MQIYSVLAILALLAICGNAVPLNAKRQWDGASEDESQQTQVYQHAAQVQENQASTDASDKQNQSGETYGDVNGSASSSWN